MGKFATKWNRPETEPSEVGNRFAPNYKLTADNDLEQDGETDIYAEIQSHADSCDINTIIRRFEMGETSILSQKNGQYVDLTEMPTTFAEMHQKIIDAQNQFEALPLDVRAEYNFSPAEFIADIGSEHWINVMSGKDPFNPEESKEEEKADE